MDEQELIRKAQKGDERAFSALLGAYESRLYALCLRYMNKNAEDARDCLQDSMLRIYRSIASFKGDCAIYTWLYRVTQTVCLDELRRRKKKVATSLDSLLEEGYSPRETDDGVDPERSVMRKQQRGAMIDLLRELPEEMRLPVLYRDVEGYSYDEIADALGVNIGTVKSRISRGRAKLRERILKNRELFDVRDV